MAVVNRRTTLAFSSAGVLFIGVVMLLDNHNAPSVNVATNGLDEEKAFLPQRSKAPSTRLFSFHLQPKFWTPPQDPQTLSLKDVRDIIQKWVAAATNRDVDAIVSLYDAKIGRLLGTVDESTSPRRDSRALIREYFNHFLGDNEKVVPMFPRFNEKDVQFTDEKTAVYSGYYTFELTPKDSASRFRVEPLRNTKIVNAKFTYIVHRTAEDGVQLVLHNSGITPAGVVMK